MATKTGNKTRPVRVEPETSSPDDDVRQILLKRARLRAKASLRWNVNTVVVAYILLAATIIVAIRVKSDWIVAIVAVVGLVLMWVAGNAQAKKQERDAVDEEIKDYLEFLSEKQEKPVPDPVQPEAPLSERELDVLRQIAAGKSNKQVALALYISEQTVKNHLKHVFDKLNVGDRTSAALLAIRNGWIRADANNL